MRSIDLLLSVLGCKAMAALRELPNTSANDLCTTPQKRVEYRTLDAATRQQYVDAVHCLDKKPAQLENGHRSRRDDYTYVHVELYRDIHFVACFLPWHRWFLFIHEQDMRECGYQGPMPYWDWTLDASDPAHSSIWDPVTGVGGNGVDRGESNYFCVEDGPFANMTVDYDRAQHVPHCVSRNFNDGDEFPGEMMGSAYSPESVAEILDSTDYDDFRQWLERKPHFAVHASCGGDMAPSSSPNDALFFMHHAQIDRLWWQWQKKGHVRDYSGRNDVSEPEYTESSSLWDDLEYLGLGPDVQVRDVMSTQSDRLCYEYV